MKRLRIESRLALNTMQKTLRVESCSRQRLVFLDVYDMFRRLDCDLAANYGIGFLRFFSATRTTRGERQHSNGAAAELSNGRMANE